MDIPLKKIADQKLKAFTIGTMGNRSLSKREQEELKKKEQEKAAAQVFEEFVATFENTPNSKVSKTWIKAGTYDAGRRQEDSKDKGKIYRPQPKIETEKSSAQKAEEYAKQLEKKGDKSKKKKEGEKKKTNLELFKEELKMIQEEREERHKYKGVVKSVLEEPEIPKTSLFSLDDVKMGSFDNGDPNTTNLYLGNLNPKITEQQLMELFGKYGPLASIKIMWPRSEEEKARGRNCGFVAYMSRKDGERALRCLNGKDVMQYEMKLGWGKGVPLPPYPIYIPPKLLELTLPPPPSGLPFNAQPPSRDKHKVPKRKPREELSPEDEEKLKKIAFQSVVKVVIPTDRNLLMLIHHMIEFVIREGPMFEAMIMNKELNNPMFSFLFENQSPAHVYYRWKLFSMLQGDSQKEWRTEEFRMFEGGSVWKPPPISPFSTGMPDELFEDDIDMKKGTLSITQRERLEDLLRHVTPEKAKVAEVMIFCVEHVDAAEEITDCIVESLSNTSTLLYKKVARLYVVSDILHNCLSKYTNASHFRILFETKLGKAFEHIHRTSEILEDPLKVEVLHNRVLNVLRSWADSYIYTRDKLAVWKAIFLGLSPEQTEEESKTEEEDDEDRNKVIDIDLDGAPLEENGEDIDGVPLDGAALLKVMKQDDPDIDGVPLEEDIDGVPMDGEDERSKQRKQQDMFDRSSAFVPSRWETVDPEEAEAQAMTTSKWEMLEAQNAKNNPQPDEDDNFPAANINIAYPENSLNEDDRRAKLREVEVKVMQYQDELESGKRSVKGGVTVSQQVEHYRKKLLRKIEKQRQEKKDRDRERERDRRSSSMEDYEGRRSKRSRSRSSDETLERKSRRSRSKSYDRSPGVYKSHQRLWSPPSGHKSSSRKRPLSPSPPPPRYKRKSPETPSARGMGTGERGRFREASVSPIRSRYRGRRSESYSPSRYGRHAAIDRSPSPISLTARKQRHKYRR